MKTPDARDAHAGLSMRIEGFRAFRDSGWFNLKTLTYLVGRNSSGKSSVLTALLLLKQTLDTPGRSRDFRIRLEQIKIEHVVEKDELTRELQTLRDYIGKLLEALKGDEAPSERTRSTNLN